MSQVITLKLPDTVYLPAQRIARATRRPLATVLVHALQASLPSLEGLSPELTAELVDLERLDDEALWQVMVGRVPTAQHRRLNHLLRKSKTAKLTETERANLAMLQNAADRIMLRKARAAVLLRFRGRRLPTASELGKLTRAE